jgi:glutamate--cysteine ligase
VHLVDEKDAIPVTSIEDLVTYFSSAGKPRDKWRVGSEHELIGVIRSTGEAPPYDGPHGIGTLLEAFARNSGTAVHESENGQTIAIARGDAQITIEPGGQFELAARPVEDDRVLVEDLTAYTRELAELSKPLDLAWLSIGMRPFGTRADIPWMPKARYHVMRDYMPTVGTRGLDMMQRTATVQANLDFANEADAAAKMRCIYAVTPMLTSLWASSPIVDEKISGFQTYRAWIWRDTDNARAGIMPFIFERDDIFTAYAEWALDVPLYFIYRGGYVRVPGGLTFRQYMKDGYQGQIATMSDWALHLSTLFPEGRLKKFIEVRGCDCGSLPMIQALGPMMRGLLYDETARTAAIDLMKHVSFSERQRIADEVPRSGFATRVGLTTVGELAKQLVAIARDGLAREAPGSVSLLDPVEAIASSGRTQSDRIIEVWKRHAGDRKSLIAALAHPGLA